MKRGNDNSQLRSDEVERLNEEESEERGTFKRASADVLATRKIFKSKRPHEANTGAQESINASNPFSFPLVNPNGASGDTKIQNVFSNPVDKESSKVNIFTNFQGFSKPNETKEVPQLTAANPFAGFKGLNVPAVKSNPATLTVAKSDVNDMYASPADVPFAESVEVNGNEYKRKMRKLNSSFFKWTNRQIDEHPQSMWRDGIQDYIRYTEELALKYGVSVDSSNAAPTASSFSSSSKAPVAAVPFSFAKAAETATSAVSEVKTKKDKVKAPLAMFAQTAPTFSGTFAFSQPLVFDKASAVPTPTVLPPFAFGAGATTVPSFSNTFAFLGAGAAPPVAAKAGGFSFNNVANNTLNPPAAVPIPSFNFGAEAPKGSIGWSLPSTGAASGFGQPLSLGTVLNTNLTAEDAEGVEAGGDDEGEPLMEPEKVLRDVNDTDIILLDVPCKLYGYNKAGNEWKDTGKGSFRVTKSADSNKQRMLVRNPIGKLTFNAGFYKGMKIEKVKGGVRFSAFVAADSTSGDSKQSAELKGFWVKMREENAELAVRALEAGVDSCQ